MAFFTVSDLPTAGVSGAITSYDGGVFVLSYLFALFDLSPKYSVLPLSSTRVMFCAETGSAIIAATINNIIVVLIIVKISS